MSEDELNHEEEVATQRNRELPFSPAVGCLLSIGIGLLAAFIVFQGLKLVRQGELSLGGGELTPRRMWLVSGPDNAGLAYESSAVTRGSRAGDSVCVRTKVRFFLWRSDDSARPASYCECFERQGDDWLSTGACDAAGEDIGG